MAAICSTCAWGSGLKKTDLKVSIMAVRLNEPQGVRAQPGG
jgi:hypothetical protein